MIILCWHIQQTFSAVLLYLCAHLSPSLNGHKNVNKYDIPLLPSTIPPLTCTRLEYTSNLLTLYFITFFWYLCKLYDRPVSRVLTPVIFSYTYYNSRRRIEKAGIAQAIKKVKMYMWSTNNITHTCPLNFSFSFSVAVGALSYKSLSICQQSNSAQTKLLYTWSQLSWIIHICTPILLLIY